MQAVFQVRLRGELFLGWLCRDRLYWNCLVLAHVAWEANHAFTFSWNEPLFGTALGLGRFSNGFCNRDPRIIVSQVRPSFFVKLEERVFIHEPSSEERRKLLGKPDIALFKASSTMMFSTASIVEIDLLRGGPRLPLNDLPSCDYCVTVFRKSNAPKIEAWPIGLRDPLPNIPIPLKGDFPDATLDLSAIIHRVYDAAGYEDYLYESQPEPPLEGADLEWAQTFIRS